MSMSPDEPQLWGASATLATPTLRCRHVLLCRATPLPLIANMLLSPLPRYDICRLRYQIIALRAFALFVCASATRAFTFATSAPLRVRLPRQRYDAARDAGASLRVTAQ